MTEQQDGVDFALAAYREDGTWTVQELVHDVLEDVDKLSHALRRFPGDGGAVGLVAMDEDFFVIVRVAGPSTRVLLSDITAADEWELASSAVEFLGLPMPEDEDDQAPAGDLDLLGDLGMHAMDMGVLLDDFDLYPDEMLSDVARRLGSAALRRRRRPHLRVSRCRARTGRCGPPSTRRAPLSASGDDPIGAVVLGRGRRGRRPRPQRPRARGDPTAHAESSRSRAAARRRVAADRRRSS